MMVYKRKKLSLAILSLLIGVGVTSSVNANVTEKNDEEILSQNLDEIIVEGDAYYGGIISGRGSLGNMLGKKDIMDIPANTTSISQEAFKSFAAPGSELMDGLTISPTVRRSTSALSFRGFYTGSDAMQVNGVSGMVSGLDMSTNFMESADIIAGPNVVYSGSATGSSSRATSGGTVSLQSKKAKLKPQTDVDVAFTGKGNFTEAVDIGRRFGKNNEWGVRINALNRNGELAVNDEKRDLRNIFLNLDHQSVKSNTNLLFGYEYKKHNGGKTYFRPQDGSASKSILPQAPDGKYNMYPGWMYEEKKSRVFVLNHDQKFTENLSAFINAGYIKSHTPVDISPSNTGYILTDGIPFDGSFKTELKISSSQSEKYYIGGGFKLNNDIGKMKNEVVIGFDKSYQKSWSGSSKSIGKFTGNIYMNNYWDKPEFDEIPLKLSSKTELVGISAVDTMKFLDDRLIAVVGVHHHSYTPYKYTNGRFVKEDSFSATCPIYGLIYKFNDNLMIYANHSEDFQTGKRVGAGYENENELLDPYKSKSDELGVKYKDKNMLHTLAFFRMKNPAYMETDDNYYAAVGLNRFKGVEYSIAGTINKKWDVFGGLAYTRWIWDKTSEGEQYTGLTANGIPKWNGSLGAVYHPDKNTSLLSRIVFVGHADIYYGKYTVPSSTRFDLGIKHKTKVSGVPVTLSAMCYNLFDRRYWYTANQGNQLLSADPRTFTISAHFEI